MEHSQVRTGYQVHDVVVSVSTNASFDCSFNCSFDRSFDCSFDCLFDCSFGCSFNSSNKANRSISCFGNSSTSNEQLPYNCISISFNCCKNPAFGRICGRTWIICPNAAFRVIPFRFIKYAVTTMGEREIPAWQCTRILPVPCLEAIAPSMISQAASVIFEMGDSIESFMERR